MLLFRIVVQLQHRFVQNHIGSIKHCERSSVEVEMILHENQIVCRRRGCHGVKRILYALPIGGFAAVFPVGLPKDETEQSVYGLHHVLRDPPILLRDRFV